MKNSIGRPRHYKTPAEMEQKVINYFEKSKKPTICGLVLFLGFESRQSFYDYENNKDFSYIIKKARLMIEQIYEEMLHGNSVTGAIFALKCFGWRDGDSLEEKNKKINIVVLDEKEKKKVNDLL